MKRSITFCTALVIAVAVGVVFGFRPQTANALEVPAYVALGDSVAAGAGLPPAIGSVEDQLCGRSAQAYPYQVAEALGATVQQLACGGAKADEGLYGPQDVNGAEIAPQLDRAFAAGTPQYMTITIGANDVRWAQVVRDCYVRQCGSKWDKVRVQAYLLDLRWELYRTLHSIKQRSNGTPPQVLLNGYFRPLDPSLTCQDTAGITAAEATWLNAQADALNDVIRDSSEWFRFSRYVPVDFSGHELCTSDPWIQGQQNPAPYHPTAAGQTAIARANIAAFRE